MTTALTTGSWIVSAVSSFAEPGQSTGKVATLLSRQQYSPAAAFRKAACRPSKSVDAKGSFQYPLEGYAKEGKHLLGAIFGISGARGKESPKCAR
jgi:hypothetical protein